MGSLNADLELVEVTYLVKSRPQVNNMMQYNGFHLIFPGWNKKSFFFCNWATR